MRRPAVSRSDGLYLTAEGGGEEMERKRYRESGAIKILPFIFFFSLPSP